MPNQLIMQHLEFDRPYLKEEYPMQFNCLQPHTKIAFHLICFIWSSERTQSTLGLVLSSLDPIPTSNLKNHLSCISIKPHPVNSRAR